MTFEHYVKKSLTSGESTVLKELEQDNLIMDEKIMWEDGED